MSPYPEGSETITPATYGPSANICRVPFHETFKTEAEKKLAKKKRKAKDRRNTPRWRLP
jgi:hypothetical protein